MKQEVKITQRKIENIKIRGIYRRELNILLMSTNPRADQGAIYIEK